MARILSPPVFESEDLTRRAQLVHRLAWVLFPLVAALGLAASWFLPANRFRWIEMVTGWLAWTLVVTGINRSGGPWPASVAMTSFCWLTCSLLAWTAGGIHAVSAPSFVLVVLIAGALLGWRAAIYSGILCCLTLLAFVFAERAAVMPPSMVVHTSMSKWLVDAFILMMAGGIQYLSAKSSKDALRISEQRFRGIFDSAYELMGLLAPDGTLLEVNRTALALIAVRREDVIGEAFWETPWWNHSPTLQQQLREQIARAAGGETVRSEADHWTADGRQVFVEYTLKPVLDERGRVTLIIPEGHDITERIRAERALHETSTSLQAAFAASPVAIAVSSLEDGTYLEVNEAALEVFGYARKEVIGRSVLEIDLWADFQQRKVLVDEVKRNGGVRNREVILRAKDGRLVTASVSARHIMFRGVECLLAVAEDITERKRAEEVLRESEVRFRTLFDLVPFAMAVHDGDGRILDVNASLLRRFGVNKEEMAGHVMSDFSALSYSGNPGETVPDLQILQEALHHPIEVHAVRRAGGQRRIVLMSAAEVVLGDRRDILTCAVDITDLKQAEDEKAKLRAQLYQAQKMEAIGRLAAGVSHDFNNLLTVIGGYTQMSMMGLSEEDHIYQPLLEVSKASRRAEDLTHQLLAFSRSQAMEPTVVNLNALIHETEKMLRRLIGEDTKLQVNLTEAAPAVRADSGRLVQVLMNLAVNARDAMPRGGLLTIETAAVDVREGDLGTSKLKPGPHVRLRVRDTGAGMDAETQSRIFEPFFTTKAVGKGTGLGLSVVYGIVEQSGGSITVESQPGAGSMFEILLPMVERREQARQRPGAEAIQSGTETVLLAEDDDAVRAFSRQVLKEAGYRVLDAADGMDALATARSHDGPIGLLVTDLRMPGMGGLEVARRLRQERSGMAVLYVSGYASSEELEAARADESAGFLRKPFAPSALLKHVRRALDRSMPQL